MCKPCNGLHVDGGIESQLERLFTCMIRIRDENIYLENKNIISISSLRASLAAGFDHSGSRLNEVPPYIIFLPHIWSYLGIPKCPGGGRSASSHHVSLDQPRILGHLWMIQRFSSENCHIIVMEVAEYPCNHGNPGPLNCPCSWEQTSMWLVCYSFVISIFAI